MEDDFEQPIRETVLAAASQALPEYTPAQWLGALTSYVTAHMAPNAAAELNRFTPELKELAQSLHLTASYQGVLLVAGDRCQTTLIRLRRGSLWYSGGNVEAELLSILGDISI